MTLSGTNTWILGGGDATLVVDPGPDIDEHLRRVAEQASVRGILLTHHHLDHAGGIERFTRLTGAEIINPAVGETLRHGDLSVHTLPTPGHTADSVSFHVTGRGEAAVCTGDTILGEGSTSVLWPDGDLAAYLDSLTALAELGAVAVLPGHGPVRADCGAAARGYLEHRRQRLDQVSAALRSGARTPEEIVETVYRDIDPALHPAAERTVQAQLAYLDGRDREHTGTLDRLGKS